MKTNPPPFDQYFMVYIINNMAPLFICTTGMKYSQSNWGI